MRFEFATATRIIFGRGAVRELAGVCLDHGRRALLVTGSNPARLDRVRSLLQSAEVTTKTFSIAGEPTIQNVESGAVAAADADVVIAIGGGSVIDAGKAIAAMATQPADVLTYLEVIGRGQSLENRPLPFIAVPTTAGTGAEVTRNAVLASPEHQVKASLRHAWMLPVVALIDPELARACPPSVTAASGMDALTQCLEAFVSCRAQPMTDALCAEGIRRAVRSLERVVTDGDDLDAREDMALAALFSGMALANAGLGAVHGFAAPLGGRFHAPHGAVCAALLAPVWEANLKAIKEAGNDAALVKFNAAAALLTGDPAADAEAGVAFLKRLTQRLAIPTLRQHGVTPEDFDLLVAGAANASSMKGNPVPLSSTELRRVLEVAW